MKLLRTPLVPALLLTVCGAYAEQPSFFVAATPTPTPATPATRSTDSKKPRPAPNKQHITDSSWISGDPEPAAQTLLNESQARQLFEKGWALIRQKKYDDALASFRDSQKLAPMRSEIPLMIGVTLFQLRKFDEAIAAYREALKIDPKDAISHYDLSVALDMSGRRAEAIDECREAVRLAPKHTVFRNYLARLLMLSDRLNDAIALLQAAGEQYPDDVVVQGTLGDIYFLAAEYEQAASIYERIARQWPDKSQVYLRLSDVYDYLERPADSIAAAKKFAELEPKVHFAQLNLGEKYQTFGYIDEAIAAYTQTTALDKNCGQAYLGLSEMYEIAGNDEAVLDSARNAYRLLPKTVPLSYRVGQLLSFYNYYAEAIEPLEFANRMRPNLPDIMGKLGWAYIEVGRYDEGVALTERAMQISPLPANMKMNLEPIKHRNELIAQFDEFKDAVAKNPNDVRSHQALAAIYDYKGMQSEVEAQRLEITKIAPTWQNFNYLTIYYQGQKEYAKALAANQKAIDLNTHHVLYMTRASILEHLGRIDEAIQAAQKAIEIKPDSLESHQTLGELFLKKGLRAEAVREYQAEFQLASGDPRPNFRLAWLYIRMGNKDGAFRHYLILKTVAPSELRYLETCLRAHFGPLPQ